MRLDCALFCDAATSREGLLNVIGGGVGITTYASYPARLELNLALRFALERTEYDSDHKLQVKVMFDEESVQTWEGGFRAGSADSDVDEIGVPVPMGIDMELAKPGKYTFEIRLDGELLAVLPLVAREGEPPN